MRLSKRFFNSTSVGVLLFTAGLAGAQTLSTCLEEGKEQYDKAQYTQATQTFSRCLQLDPQNVEAHLSLAGTLLTQEDLTNAQLHFEEALKNMQRSSPYWSYTYSMLGDIALKRKQHKQALSLYQKSLEYNAANVNSLIGKGVILESQGDPQSAADSYAAALAVEPLNVIARKRLIRLEPEYLSDEEILTALKQRYAIKPETAVLTEENRNLFVKIHQAERRRGIDYLKNKYGPAAKEMIVTLNKGSDFSREILTLNGYKTLQKNMGQDAVAVFRKLNIPVQDVFALRDKQGKPVFAKDSTLTEEGFYVYTQALTGKKEYLLPHQAVPLTPAELKRSQQKAQALLQKGYAEISRSELKLLENQTLCSEDTLKKHLGVYFLPITKKQYRFFVRTTDTDSLKTIPYYYVMKARHKRNPKLQIPKNDLVDYYQFYGYTICLSDGNLTLENK